MQICRAMVSAMRAFPESEDVQSHGTGILAAMVSVPELALSMARCSGGSVCTLAAERFASDTEVCAPVLFLPVITVACM